MQTRNNEVDSALPALDAVVPSVKIPCIKKTNIMKNKKMTQFTLNYYSEPFALFDSIKCI